MVQGEGEKREGQGIGNRKQHSWTAEWTNDAEGARGGPGFGSQFHSLTVIRGGRGVFIFRLTLPASERRARIYAHFAHIGARREGSGWAGSDARRAAKPHRLRGNQFHCAPRAGNDAQEFRRARDQGLRD
jgi:hypothetical protein